MEISSGVERRGVKRPAENSNPDCGDCTIQKCINCKEESDTFVPVVCSHVFCTQCYNRLFADLEPGAQARCPEDGRVIVPDYGVISNSTGGNGELVPQVRMPCTNKERGCEKMIFFHEMEDHLNGCVYRLLPSCPQGCNEKVVYKDLITHLTSSCNCRLVKCQYCTDDVPLNVLEKHELHCPQKPVTCPHCNKEKILQKELHIHIETCPMSPGLCVMREMGCVFEGTKKDIEVHQMSWKQHIEVLVKCVSSLQGQLNELNSRIDDLQNHGVSSSQTNTPGSTQETQLEESADTIIEEEMVVETTEDVQDDDVPLNDQTTQMDSVRPEEVQDDDVPLNDQMDSVRFGEDSSSATDISVPQPFKELSVKERKSNNKTSRPVHVPVVGSSTLSTRRLRSHNRSNSSSEKESPRGHAELSCLSQASPTSSKPKVTDTCSISAVDWSTMLDLDLVAIKEEPPISSTERDSLQIMDQDDGDDSDIEIVYMGDNLTSSAWRCPTCLNKNGPIVNFCKLCTSRRPNQPA